MFASIFFAMMVIYWNTWEVRLSPKITNNPPASNIFYGMSRLIWRILDTQFVLQIKLSSEKKINHNFVCCFVVDFYY